MAAIFLFVSPVVLDDRMWLGWRRSMHHVTESPSSGRKCYGDQLVIDDSGRISESESQGALRQIERAIVASRFNSGMMCDLPDLFSRVRQAFEGIFPKTQISVASWVLASRHDGAAVVTAIATDADATIISAQLDQAEARRRYDTAVFAGQNATALTEAADCLRTSGLDAGDATIRRDATQLLCMVETRDAPPTGLLHVHDAEEGDRDNCAPLLDLSESLCSYLHIGWSYTTVVGSSMHQLASLAPIAIRAQSIWFTQRQLRTCLSGVDFDGARQGRKSTTGLLLLFQELRFDLHMWDSEIESYRTALVPWQARIFERYISSWSIPDTYDRLTSLVDHGCDLLRSTAERFDGIMEARQANILAIIAILTLLGIPAAIAGYLDLAERAHIDLASIANSTAFDMMVASLPVVTGVAIVALILMASRRR